MSEAIELVELTDAEWAALQTLAKMRADGHGHSCACRPCIQARAVWAGDRDELERLLGDVNASK